MNMHIAEVKFDMSGPFDRQALFNKAYLGLASQGFQKSTDGSGSGFCVYRAPNGAKCALGWLIPDEDYHPSMEGHVSSSLVTGLNANDADWIYRLQNIHDASAQMLFTMKERLVSFAKDYGLTVPDLNPLGHTPQSIGRSQAVYCH